MGGQPNPIIVKFPAMFPPPMGFRDDHFYGFRSAPDAACYWVDGRIGNDAWSGTDPEYPVATIGQAVANLRPTADVGAQIFIAPGTYTESVVTPAYNVGPSYVSLIGLGPSRYSVSWTSDGATPCLDMRAVGWRVQNIRFYGQATSACVILRHTDSGANDIAIRTIIEDCYFDGLTTGLRGIESHGCYDVWVINCTFKLWNNVANDAIGMEVTTTPLAIPYRNHIIGNVFEDSDNGMAWESNGSLFQGNVVKPVGYAYAMTITFQSSTIANAGDDNHVVGNYFGGDYSLAGGYRGGAADEFYGCYSPDTAEAEVSASGIVILPPA